MQHGAVCGELTPMAGTLEPRFAGDPVDGATEMGAARAERLDRLSLLLPEADHALVLALPPGVACHVADWHRDRLWTELRDPSDPDQRLHRAARRRGDAQSDRRQADDRRDGEPDGLCRPIHEYSSRHVFHPGHCYLYPVCVP